MRYKRIPEHKRKAALLARSKEYQGRLHVTHYTQVDRFMCSFEQAYREYYNVDPSLTYSHGWYYLSSTGRRYRHADLEAFLGLLLARIQEQQSPNPDLTQLGE